MKVFYLVAFLSVFVAFFVLWQSNEITSKNVFIEQVYAETDSGLVSEGREGDYSPDGYGSCEFVSTVNNVIRFLIELTGVFAVIVFLYAGFMMTSSRGDPALIAQAKGVFSNVLIGFMILVAAFLIINTILGILVGGAKGGFTWQTVECTYSEKSDPAAKIAVEMSVYDGITVMSSNKNFYPDAIIRGTGGGSTYELGDCSPDNLKKYGMTQSQANTFSCIARPESGCNLNADAPESTARGVFQIIRGINDKGHNLNFPECTKAAQDKGYAVSGNLNCSRAFSGGDRKPGKNPLADACDVAASNMKCNVTAALWLYNAAGNSYSPWLADKRSSKQSACVAKFGS